ncbi:MAG: hypothetical protein ACJ8EB_11380 [Allosphingosinicella sp.]
MFEALSARAAATAARAAARQRTRIEAVLRDDAPRGVAVRGVPEGVAIEGRGLRRRAVAEPALRDFLERIRG